MFRVLRPTWWLALLKLLGRHGRPYRGPRSDHFDGERFHNLEPKAHKSLGDVLKWRFSRPPQMQWVAQPGPEVPAEIVSRVHGAELRVTYINHATLLIQQHGLKRIHVEGLAEKEEFIFDAKVSALRKNGLELVELRNQLIHSHFNQGLFLAVGDIKLIG